MDITTITTRINMHAVTAALNETIRSHDRTNASDRAQPPLDCGIPRRTSPQHALRHAGHEPTAVVDELGLRCASNV